MRKRSRRIILLLAALTVAFAALLLAGCSLGVSLDEIIDRENLQAKVTYHANGGAFENNADTKDIYYRAGTPAIDIGHVRPSSGTLSISRSNYDFVAWFYAQLDSEGNPAYTDESKTTVALGEQFDFSVPLEAGDDIHLYAGWQRQSSVLVRYAGEVTVTGEDGESYEPGDVIAEYGFGTQGAVYMPSSFTEFAGSTFVEFYADEDCTQKVSWPIMQSEEDVYIYAKYIEGEWTVVKNWNTFRTAMLQSSISNGERKIYINEDIDGGGGSIVITGTLACTIEGNGHTVRNFVVERTVSRDSYYGMFDTIAATAVMRDTRFEGINLTVNARNFISGIGYFAGRIEEGAAIENVSFSGGTLTVGLASNAATGNIVKTEGGEWTTERLYVSDTLDTSLTEKYPSLTFENIDLKVE